MVATSGSGTGWTTVGVGGADDKGQAVKRGQLLLEMDGSELQANLAQATAAEQLAASNMRLLSELKQPLADQALAQAQLHLRGAQRTAARAQELYAQGFYGAAATEEAQRALDLAQTQVTIAARQRASRSTCNKLIGST